MVICELADGAENSAYIPFSVGQIIVYHLFGFCFSRDIVALTMVNWLTLETQGSCLPQALEWLS